MKLTKKIRILFLTYLWVFPLLYGVLYFGVFKPQNQLLDDVIIGYTATDPTSVLRLQLNHEMMLLSVIAVLPTVYFLRGRPKAALSAVMATGTIILLATFIILIVTKWLLPLLYIFLTLVLGTGVAIILKMIFASTQAEFLRLAFSQFVSVDMLKELMKNPEKLKLAGKEVEVTVMFLDIRGFTTFSEKSTPALVVNRLNDLLDKVTHLILEHNGTVDKYMGDAVMAFWGAPNTDKKQASNACRAALAIATKIETETEFKVGIGINHGMAIVGNMGSTRRFDYTVIGDTVNTAARLESATKEIGATIVISESVKRKLLEEKAELSVKEIGTIKVKGKENGIHVHALENK